MIHRLISFILLGLAWLIAFALFLPCLLIFSESHDGSITVWNFVGIAWAVCLGFIFSKIHKDDGQDREI